MTIRPYASMTAQLESSQYTENSSSNLIQERDEKPLKKLRIESSKAEQIAHSILDTYHNQDSDAGANFLNVHQIVNNDKSDTEKESFIQAIHGNPKEGNAYHKLANCLENEETVQLLSGEIYTNKELYLKAIELNTEDADFYYNLANCLENEEKIQLLSGETYTNKELYLKAIELEPEDADFYHSLANCLENEETIQLLSGETYTDKELYLKAIDLNSEYANSYHNLATCLENEEAVQFFNGKIYTKKELCLKAIELDPEYIDPYHNLATCLANEETIQLLNGEIYTNKELYLKAIELDPENANSYYNLANYLENDETVQFLSGEVYTKKELYLKAIELDPEDTDFYYNLANCLENEETVQLLSGEIYTNKEIYLKAIELNPENEIHYQHLANLLDNEETIQFLNGEAYTKKKLYYKIIELNPKNEIYYQRLANLLDDKETIQFLNGEAYTKKKLYCKIIELNPNNGIHYKDLANCLENEETIQLLSGEIYTQKELYGKCIELGSVEEMCYSTRHELGEIYFKEIKKNPKILENYFRLITLVLNHNFYFDEELADIEFFFKKAFDIDPTQAFSLQSASAVFSLASMLHNQVMHHSSREINLSFLTKESTVTLKNDQVMSIQALYQHALPFLSLTYLQCRKDEGLGDYLSYRKPVILQDGTKFTKLMAYMYACEKNPSGYIFMKIGDALHPEQRITWGKTCYSKKECYEEIHKDHSLRVPHEYYNSFFKMAEVLYPQEQLKKKDLFNKALEEVYNQSGNPWRAGILLAQIFAQYEGKDLLPKYLLATSEYIKMFDQMEQEGLLKSSGNFYKNSDNFVMTDDIYFTKKQEFLLALLKHVPSCEEAYVALAKNFEHPLSIHEKSYASKESLYLKAIDINSEYSLPYFLLGKELFFKKIESIQLLNGVTLSCKQLLMRAIQLGTYEAGAYHLAAFIMDDKDGILLFDGKTILSRGDLFIRAFELDFTRVVDLNNFISYVKRHQKTQLKS